MKKDINVYVQHILNAIKKIENYTKDTTLKSFRKDEMKHDAVVRQLEIIGEAVSRLPKTFAKENSDFPRRKAVDMRNYLIHGYDDIDLKIVWETVVKDLPKLKDYLQDLPQK